MSYTEGAAPATSLFDNVFVNPEAHEAFLRTGTWPDKTILVKENRDAASAGSIIAFHHHRGDLTAGDTGVICSFGAGYSIGSVIVRKR